MSVITYSRSQLWLVSFAVAALTGCGKPSDVRPSLSQEPVETQYSAAAKEVLKYASTPSSPSTAKIFLVAGGRDNANFAQEVVEQKKHFLSLGFQETDIECYYTRPFDRQFVADEKQYTAIAKDLESCLPANPALIYKRLGEAGKYSKEFFYFYVTSHGGDPYSVWRKEIRNPLTRAKLDEANGEDKVLDQYMISVDALATGEASDMFMRIGRIIEGAKPKSLLFTPRYFKEALSAFPADLPKYVVLQACHSGGFLDTDDKDHLKDTLRDVPNLTAMAAAQHDRSSFGCNSGAERTYFGGAYTDKLVEAKAAPLKIEWKKLFDDVNQVVTGMEAKLPRVKPSLPVYYTNVKK